LLQLSEERVPFTADLLESILRCLNQLIQQRRYLYEISDSDRVEKLLDVLAYKLSKQGLASILNLTAALVVSKLQNFYRILYLDESKFHRRHRCSKNCGVFVFYLTVHIIFLIFSPIVVKDFTRSWFIQTYALRCRSRIKATKVT
jgi:hypothetical protein